MQPIEFLQLLIVLIANHKQFATHFMYAALFTCLPLLILVVLTVEIDLRISFNRVQINIVYKGLFAQRKQK